MECNCALRVLALVGTLRWKWDIVPARCGIAGHILGHLVSPVLQPGPASVHRSIFHRLAAMEDTVGEELAAGFEIEAQLHASRVGSRRDGAGLTARTVIQHIVELEEIASAACASFVVQRQRLSVDELIAAVENVGVKPYVLRVSDVLYPRAEFYTRLKFGSADPAGLNWWRCFSIVRASAFTTSRFVCAPWRDRFHPLSPRASCIACLPGTFCMC